MPPHHLHESKGLKFWIPPTKKFVSLKWADYGRNFLPVNKDKNNTNHLALGSFENDCTGAKQEANIDSLQTGEIPAVFKTPSTFKEAMR